MEKITSYAISMENTLYKYEQFARVHDDVYELFRINVDKYYDSDIEDNIWKLKNAWHCLGQQFELDKSLNSDESIAKLLDITVLAINQIAKARNNFPATVQGHTTLCPVVEAVDKLKINE